MCILVVEDEPLIRMIVVEELQEAGFEVYEAETSDMAANLITGQVKSLTMLITDIHMPGKLNGLHIAEIMRRHFPAAPIVYTTGRPDVVDYLRAHDTLLSKPYVPSSLMSIVRHALLPAGHDPTAHHKVAT